MPVPFPSEPLSFPPLPPLPNAADADWPWPPGLRGASAWPPASIAQACEIETRTGTTVTGELVDLRRESGTLMFRTHADGPVVRLTFARIRSVTLTATVAIGEAHAAAPVPLKPPAAGAAFRVDWATDGQGTYAGLTMGHVHADEGLYLFPAVAGGDAVQRVFIPRSAYQTWAVTSDQPSAELPASHGIADLAELLAAVDQQQSLTVLRIGQSLIDLGFLTQAQLAKALAEQPDDVPLGEMLVSASVISRPDLLTALAHKMGYPFVDLARFPVDYELAGMLTFAEATALSAIPIALDGDRLIVAMDRPASVARLRGLTRHSVVPVIAPMSRITQAIAKLPHTDVWIDHAPRR